MSWGYVAVGAGTLIAGYLGSEASSDASDAQTGASNAATQLQRDQYNQTRADNAPWRAAGENALNRLTGLLNDGSLTSRFTGADVANDPGYQFGLNQGMRAIDNSASARGGIGGAALKAGTRYAQDYAGTKFGQAFDRNRMEQSDIFNRLSGLAGTGQQTNAANSAAGANFANQAGANMIGAGNAQAANALNQGNIYGNAVNQLGAYGSRNNWWQSGSTAGGYNAGVGGLGAGGSPDGYW